MNYPSIKTLQSINGVDKDAAKGKVTYRVTDYGTIVERFSL